MLAIKTFCGFLIASPNHHRLLLVISLEIEEIGIPRAHQGSVGALGTWGVFRPYPDPHVPEIGQLDQLLSNYTLGVTYLSFSV